MAIPGRSPLNSPGHVIPVARKSIKVNRSFSGQTAKRPVIWLAMKRITGSHWHLLKMKMLTTACTGNQKGAKSPFFARMHFFLSILQEKKGAKKEIQRAAFMKSEQNPPHLLILEILAKLPAEKGKTVNGALLMEPAPFRLIHDQQ